MKTANSIDEVIQNLSEIIDWATTNNSRLGYFPALYRKVTVKVKEGIQNHFFDDNERMERLDVVFANRYLKAFEQFQTGQEPTQSWQLAFEATAKWWPIVLQHLLLGMNAHILLDLGIAAAEVVPPEQIDDLENDFAKINQILNDLVEEVQNELGEISPLFRFLDMKTGKFDEALAKFGIEVTRNQAWGVACDFAATPKENWPTKIESLDQQIFNFGQKILSANSIWLRMVLGFIRLGEIHGTKKVIEILK